MYTLSSAESIQLMIHYIKSAVSFIFLSCKTTTTFGLVTVADMLSNTRHGIIYMKSKPLSVVPLQNYRHAEVFEMLYMYLMLFAIVNLRKYNKLEKLGYFKQKCRQ